MSQPPSPPTILGYFNATASSYEKTGGGSARELAEKITPLLSGIGPESVILDNACGTGIITDVILKGLDPADKKPVIHAVDFAPNMVEIAKTRFANEPTVHGGVMSGEALSFSDNTFTHSVTNLGLFLFSDAAKGSDEIYRTLKPGGTAIVTGWEILGYLAVVQNVQHAIHPEEPPWNLPLSKDWFLPSKHEQTLRDSGFQDINMSSADVHFAADTLASLSELIFTLFGLGAFKDWNDEDKEKAKSLFPQYLEPVAKAFERKDGTKAVGVPMKAIVAVCTK